MTPRPTGRSESGPADPESSSLEGNDWTPERLAIYRRLRDRSAEGASDVAQLIARHGAPILDRGIPYLSVAIHRMEIDRARDAQRRRRLAKDVAEAGATPFADTDPAAIVESRESLREAVQALAKLAPADQWALWWHAAGYDDDEIRVMWDEIGLRPAHPTRASIRKRRERARRELRRLVGESGPLSP